MAIDGYYRGQKGKMSKQVVPIFSIGHYVPLNKGEDSFSKELNFFYMYGNDEYMQKFLEMFIHLYEKRFKEDIIFDYVCVAPSSSENSINENMKNLILLFSKSTNIPYVKILKRNKPIKKQHELDNINERIENVKGSISVDFDVSNKNILVFDNTSTTGLSFEEIQIELKSKGANKIIFFCIGLGSKHKEFDFDINSNTILKATHIIENWHWPKSDRKNSKSN